MSGRGGSIAEIAGRATGRRQPERRQAGPGSAGAARRRAAKRTPWFGRLHRAIIDDRSMLVMVTLPRRGGKDYTVAAKVVLDRVRGVSERDCSYITLDKRRADEWMGYVKEHLKRVRAAFEVLGAEEVQGDDTYYVSSIKMTCLSGKVVTIRALSSSVTGARGRDGDVILSELAFHKAGRELYDAAAPCMTNGGQMLIVSTVNVEGDFHHELEQMAERRLAGTPEPGDLEISLHRHTIDEVAEAGFAEGDGYLNVLNAVHGTDHTPETYVARAKSLARSREVLLREFYNVRPKDASAYFPLALINACLDRDADPGLYYDAPQGYITDRRAQQEVGLATRGVIDLVIARLDRAAEQQGGPIYAGIDFGRTADLFAVWIAQRVAGVLRPVAIFGWRGVGFAEMDAALDRLLAWRGRAGHHARLSRVCGDRNGLGMASMEKLVRAYGSARVLDVAMTNQSKQQLYPYFRGELEGQRFIVPDDPRVVGAINAVRRGTSATGLPVFDAKSTADGHADEATAAVLCAAAADVEPSQARGVAIAGGALA